MVIPSVDSLPLVNSLRHSVIISRLVLLSSGSGEVPLVDVRILLFSGLMRRPMSLASRFNS